MREHFGVGLSEQGPLTRFCVSRDKEQALLHGHVREEGRNAWLFPGTTVWPAQRARRPWMGRAGDNNRTLCHVLELKCSQVAGEGVSMRMMLRRMNEGQVGINSVKNGGRRTSWKGDEHMQKAEEDLVTETKLESQMMMPRSKNSDELTVLMTAVRVIQDENPAQFTKQLTAWFI